MRDFEMHLNFRKYAKYYYSYNLLFIHWGLEPAIRSGKQASPVLLHTH